MRGSYTIDARVSVERELREDAEPIATSGEDDASLHASIYKDEGGWPQVMLHTALENDVHVYLRMDLEAALWLAKQIIAAAQDVRLPKAVELSVAYGMGS